MNAKPSTITGWPDAGPAPDRGDVLAAAELADVRRILAVDVTERTIIPAHEWALRDTAPVRLEIHAGTSLADVTRALRRLLDVLPTHWEVLTDELGAAAAAKEYERVDFRNGTIDGAPWQRYPTPASAGGVKAEDGSTGV